MSEHTEDNDISIGEAILSNAITEVILKAFNALDKETPSDTEIDYKPLYYGLFNGISAILENTTTYEQTVAALKYLQCKAEEAYIEQGE
jgi:hypothetical protein